MDVKTRLGQRVKELRLIHGYTQEEFAHKCGLDRTYITTSLENGKRNVSIVNISKISSALNLSLRFFFDSELFHEH